MGKVILATKSSACLQSLACPLLTNVFLLELRPGGLPNDFNRLLQRNLQKLREVLTYKDKYFFQICHSSCFYHKTFFLRNLWPNGCKLQIFTNLRGKLRTEFCCNYKNVILGSVKLHGIGSWPQSLKNSLILSLTINMKENTLSLI